jgi:nucleotide-binding universal stress UspA family protein
MKDILVPIDFSPYSLSAAKAAAVIAIKCGSNVHLLHIADIPVGWDKQSVAQQQKYPLFKLPIFKNCNVGTNVQGGVPVEQINIFAKRNKMTLIVMGVHGAGESELKFIGSTAQRVIRTAPCPVLGVKKNFNFGSLKKILFASDFDEDVSGPVNSIKNLAYDFGANIDFAYVNTASHFVDDNTMQARMKNFVIVQKRVKFHTVIQNSNEKEEGILECAKKRNANMIGMVTHLRREKSSYLIGMTESILFKSKLPVLSFVIDESRYQLK